MKFLLFNNLKTLKIGNLTFTMNNSGLIFLLKSGHTIQKRYNLRPEYSKATTQRILQE